MEFSVVMISFLTFLSLFFFLHQQLHRSWNLVESFAASFCALNFIGGVRFVKKEISILLLLTDVVQ